MKPWILALAALCTAAGCIESNLVSCADGLACPIGDRCDEVHHSCVQPEQFTVCSGVADGADCTAGPTSGGCFDGVCLPRGCGNRVLEPGEMCDDGNQISGDGCNGSCTSTERCGNGFVDPGEACDDGGLISHDGCDSQCRLETAAWSKPVAIAPGYLSARGAAYDVARHRLVDVRSDATWEWDGARWMRQPAAAAVEIVFYDPGRQQTAMIGVDLDAVAHLYVWVDAAWQQVTGGDEPAFDETYPGMIAAYDTAHHRAIVVDLGMTDPTPVKAVGAAAQWTELPPIPAAVSGGAVGYDAESDHVVVETDTGTEWVFDGAAWTSSTSELGALTSLAFDPDRGHLIAIDGVTGATHERIAAAWQAIDGDPTPCASSDSYEPLPTYYNPDAAAIEVMSATGRKICRWNGVWTASEPALPFLPIAAAYDPVRRMPIVLHNAHPDDRNARIEAWTPVGDRWQLVDVLDAAAGVTEPLAVYSPGRAATMLFGERSRKEVPDDGPVISDCTAYDHHADTWSFDGADWRMIGSFSTNAPACTRSAATYDPEHGRVVLATFDELWSLADGADAWTRIATPSSGGQIDSVAWDARNGVLLAARQIEYGDPSPLSELRDGEWVPLEVTPNGFSFGPTALVADQRAGGVLAITGSSGATWERIAGTWTKLPSVPMANLYAAWTAYNPVDGSVLFIGRTEDGVFSSTLTRASATPFETCAPDADADGDGLAGCADPDCYWQCSRCLPHTSCR